MCMKGGICAAMIFARIMALCSCIFYITYSAIMWAQLLLQFSKHFLQTFKDEEPRHVDVHEGRNLRSISRYTGLCSLYKYLVKGARKLCIGAKHRAH